MSTSTSVTPAKTPRVKANKRNSSAVEDVPVTPVVTKKQRKSGKAPAAEETVGMEEEPVDDDEAQEAVALQGQIIFFKGKC